TLLDQAAAAVHLVGIIVESGPATFTAIHVEGTARVLDAAATGGVRRLVHLSAVGARPDPRATPDHRTKWQADQLVRRSGPLATCCTCPFRSPAWERGCAIPWAPGRPSRAISCECWWKGP